MDDGTARGIHVTPGDGVVAQLGTFVAYAIGDDDGVNHLIVRLNALADAPWDEVVRTLTSDIAQAGYDDHPQLACASIGDEQVGVLVFGNLRLAVTTDNEMRVFDGRDSSTWIDLKVRGVAERILCGEQSESNVVGVLRDGVVPGGGFLFDRLGPIPAATRWRDDTGSQATDAEVAAPDPDRRQPTVEDPATAAPDPVESEGGDDAASVEPPEAQRVPTPVLGPDPATVSGVLCPEGHLTDPGAPICHRCGSSVPPDAEGASGPRPSLGTLTFDDGATLELDRPVVIGAEVPAGYTVDGEAAIVVELDNEDGSIAPVHVELHVANWQVDVVDQQSTGGTFLRARRELQSRTRLRPLQPTELTPGCEVKLGSRSFVYTVGPPPPAGAEVTAAELAWLQAQQ